MIQSVLEYVSGEFVQIKGEYMPLTKKAKEYTVLVLGVYLF